MATISNDFQKRNSSLAPNQGNAGKEMGASRASTIKENMPRTSIGAESGTTINSTQVRLTKQMIKDRERFLGVSSRPRGGGRFKDLPGANTKGNSSLEQVWNTTGFLPKSIDPAGQKNSVKDFEYLKFVNDTMLKDEVLDKFMQKAGEIEQAAGPK